MQVHANRDAHTRVYAPHGHHLRRRDARLLCAPPPSPSSRSAPTTRVSRGVGISPVNIRYRAVADASLPFKPSGVVDAVEPEGGPRLLGRFTAGDVYYWLNVAYWGLLLASVLTGNEAISRVVAFENYSTAMFAASAAFAAFHVARFVWDLRQHLKVGA